MTQTQTTKLGRRIKFWQLLLAIAIVGAGLALLPERIGIPIFLMIEGALIVTLLILLIAAVYRKFATKRSDKSDRSSS